MDRAVKVGSAAWMDACIFLLEGGSGTRFNMVE